MKRPSQKDSLFYLAEIERHRGLPLRHKGTKNFDKNSRIGFFILCDPSCLIARQSSSRRRVVPLWHNINKEIVWPDR